MNMKRKLVALFAVFLMIFGNMPLAIAAGWEYPQQEFGQFSQLSGLVGAKIGTGGYDGYYNPSMSATMMLWYEDQNTVTRDQLNDTAPKWVTVKGGKYFYLYQVNGDGVYTTAYATTDTLTDVFTITISGNSVEVKYTNDGTTARGISHIAVFFNSTPRTEEGTLTVDKVVNGDNVTDADRAFAFSFKVVGPAPAATERTVTASDGANGSLTLPYGSYTISEINLPDGFESQLDKSTFVIGSGTTRVTVTATNTKKAGTLIVDKVINGDNVTDADRSFAFSFKVIGPAPATTERTVSASDAANGTLSLPYGSYQISEVNIPAGFAASLDKTSFVIGEDTASVTVIATNTKKAGTLTVKKSIDSPLLNAFVTDADKKINFKFKVVGPAPATTERFVTASDSANGTLSLPYGSYTISEVDIPNGFSGSPTMSKTSFTISDLQTSITVKATNHKLLGSLTIRKALAGEGIGFLDHYRFFKFSVVGPANDPKTWTIWASDSMNGLQWLPYGDYTISEVDVPEGFVPSFDRTAFTIGPDATDITVTATNTKTLGSVSITKALSGIDGDMASGKSFVFQLEKKNENGNFVPYATAKGVDNGGAASFTGLPWGVYRLSEQPVDGYSLLSIVGDGLGEGNTFTVGLAKQSFVFIATNDAPRGSVSVTKAVNGLGDQATGKTFVFRLLRKNTDGGYVEYAVADGVDNGGVASFGNLPWGDYKIAEDVVDGYPLLSITGSGLSSDYTFTVGPNALGFEFTATNDKPLGSVLVTKAVSGLDNQTTTGKSFVFRLLQKNGEGEYVEYATATGVDNGGVATFSQLPWGEYKIVEDAVTDYPLLSISGNGIGEGDTFVVGPQQQTFAFTATNDKPLGNITVRKTVQGAGEQATGQSFTFTLYRMDEKEQLVPVGTVTLDNGGTGSFTDLPWGSYYLRETGIPVGYEFVSLSSGKTTITNPDQAIQLTVDGDALSVSASGVNRKLGNLLIVKTDAATGAKLAGAEFSLADNADFTGAVTLTTKADGTVTSAALKPGQWFVKETKAPAGYDLDATVRTVTIALGQTTEISLTNNLSLGALRLIKVDATNQQTTLPGAAFNIYSDEARTKLAASGLTDAKGEINISKLVPGTYWVVETAAPTGYKLNATPVSVAITANNLTIMTLLNTKDDTKEFNDEKAILKLLKVDGYSQKALEGAKFNLYSDSALQTLVATGTTDVNGLIEFKDLTPGTYYAVETAAPKGYKLNSAPISVVTEAAKTSTLTISNELDDTKDYQTGSMDYNILIGGGMALLVGGLLVLFTRRRKSKKN